MGGGPSTPPSKTTPRPDTPTMQQSICTFDVSCQTIWTEAVVHPGVVWFKGMEAQYLSGIFVTVIIIVRVVRCYVYVPWGAPQEKWSHKYVWGEWECIYEQRRRLCFMYLCLIFMNACVLIPFAITCNAVAQWSHRCTWERKCSIDARHRVRRRNS